MCNLFGGFSEGYGGGVVWLCGFCKVKTSGLYSDDDDIDTEAV
jgi:hypothetical protein